MSTYLLKQKKWIKSNVPYKPQKRGFGKKLIWSSRFGFLDLYNRKEQQELRCPSGYSIGQCFNVMRKLWYGYLKSMCDEKDIDKMKKYAIAIQSVQKDMGIKTTSFPHLGIFGDQLFLNYKKGEHAVSEWPSALEKQQQEYDKRAAENAKKIQEHVMKPDVEKGEKILAHADMSYKIRRRPPAEMLVPDVLVPDEEKGERLLVISDETPFRETIKTHVDKSYKAKRRPPAEMLVPDALVPDEEEGEELIVMSDKWSAENAKKIQEHVMKPDVEKGEKILTHADMSYKIRRRPSAEMLVPEVLVPDEEKGERLLVISDETPFRETIKTHVDKSYKAKRRPPAEMLVPDALVPDEEEGEELIVMSDEIPFRD